MPPPPSGAGHSSRPQQAPPPPDIRLLFDDGSQLLAHSAILSLASAVFRDLLASTNGGGGGWGEEGQEGQEWQAEGQEREAALESSLAGLRPSRLLRGGGDAEAPPGPGALLAAAERRACLGAAGAGGGTSEAASPAAPSAQPAGPGPEPASIPLLGDSSEAWAELLAYLYPPQGASARPTISWVRPRAPCARRAQPPTRIY
jgi:hypothetical protein